MWCIVLHSSSLKHFPGPRPLLSVSPRLISTLQSEERVNSLAVALLGAQAGYDHLVLLEL